LKNKQNSSKEAAGHGDDFSQLIQSIAQNSGAGVFRCVDLLAETIPFECD